MKKLKIILLAVTVIFIALQFYRPDLPSPKITQDFSGPNEIKQILKRSCYDCHSNETQLAWFDQINPAYLIVRSHVQKGRSFLNFSNWDKLSEKKKRLKLFDALNVVKTFNRMPLPEYTFLHPEAKLTANEIDKFEKYVLSLEKEVPDFKLNQSDNKINTKHKAVKATPNGIEFISDYKDWQIIGTSERFDHNSIRIIYGNNIALRAINNNQNIPYPDGSILAKVLWERVKNENGDIIPGKFIHVEFMIKDKVKFESTKGWGWARWIGDELKPFGKDKTFSNSCINCHVPVKDKDYTFTPAIKFSKNN